MLGVFKAVKAAWRKCLTTFYDETRYRNLDKAHYPMLLKRFYDTGAFSVHDSSLS